jgi:hypothetical protein
MYSMFISATRRKPAPINVDVDDDDDDDENAMDADVSDEHSSIPVARRHPAAPTTSKDTHYTASGTESESGRKSNEDEDEPDDEDPDNLDLLHLDKASLKKKMSSEVCFL